MTNNNTKQNNKKMSTCPLNPRKPCKQFMVGKMTKDFVSRNIDYENYVLVYSKDLAKIFEENVIADVADDDDKFEGLVKIRHGKKVVYRKCVARNGMVKNGIGIGHRTLGKLGISKADYSESVCVMPASWFCYLLHHNNSAVRWPFIIAVVSLVVTLLSTVAEWVVRCCQL